MAQPIDDDDEDLRRAIALSLAELDESEDPAKDVNGKAVDPLSLILNLADREQASVALASSQDAPVAQPVPRSGIMGLDRKAMEQERLARARKREAPISPPRVNRDKSPTAKRQKIEEPGLGVLNSKGMIGNNGGNRGSTLRFPRATVKKTFSPRHPKDPGIKIEEILDKDNLKTAVLSTFIIDADWIFSKLDIKKTKFYMILHAKDDRARKMYNDDFSGVGVARVCLPPPWGAYGCMHSKLMLLFFADFMRIVIPSANLTDYDWGETGVMENTVFLIDLPRLASQRKIGLEELTFFGKELLNFLKMQGVDDDVREGILNFDFAETIQLVFVHTAAGAHYGTAMRRTGYLGLSAAVRQLGLQSDDPVKIDIATSSLGSLNDRIINTMYAAAQGKDCIDAQEQMKKVSKRVHENMRIYFPTRETVNQSIGGFDSAGTICLQRNYYDKPDFPKTLLRDMKSTRSGLLSHNKIMLVCGNGKAWAYVGSANLSESAWGRMVMDKSRKEPKLSCGNWECGVLIPSSAPSGLGSIDADFKDILDVPFEYGDGLEYDGRQPWLFKN